MNLIMPFNDMEENITILILGLGGLIFTGSIALVALIETTREKST